MQVFTDESEFTDVQMIQRVVGMFETRRIQRILSYGFLGFEYDDDELDVDDHDSWSHQRNSFYGYQDGRRLSRNHSRSSSSIFQPSLSYSSARSSSGSPSLKVQPKESDIERKARLLQEAKKSKEKAEKKRLKKQKQKERKQMEKEKLNKEGNAPEDDKSVNDPKNDEPDSSEKNSAAAKDTDSDCKSSEYESSYEEEDTKDSGDEEELDLTSTFVSKAALIARRKSEQKHTFEKKKKKSPEKVKSKSVRDQEELALKEAQRKDSVAPASLTFEDNVKISTDLAIMGNKFASSGDYNMAVKYYTDAIKYNPKEYKLFGNRSFCFEKLQECEKALADAELSLGFCPGWVKGLFRKGRALAGLKRYEEAADAFRDVLKRESSYAEAAQELMRVQIIQLMECGFTREQSSNALIIHGTVKKALEVLSKLHPQPGAVIDAPPPAQATSITGVSPVLSANTRASLVAAQPHTIPEKQPLKEPLVPTPNISSVKTNYTQATKTDYNPPPLELFPVWVGNLSFPLTESTITNLFSKAGVVHSVKVLPYKRCAFVNFTNAEHCDEAIRRFHGSVLNGVRMAVKYPDRIPPGMGMSRSALRSQDLQEQNPRPNSNWRRAVEDPLPD